MVRKMETAREMKMGREMEIRGDMEWRERKMEIWEKQRQKDEGMNQYRLQDTLCILVPSLCNKALQAMHVINEMYRFPAQTKKCMQQNVDRRGLILLLNNRPLAEPPCFSFYCTLGTYLLRDGKLSQDRKQCNAIEFSKTNTVRYKTNVPETVF